MQWLRGCQRFGALLRVADGCAGYAETQPRPAPPKRSGCSMLRLSTLSTSGPRSTRSAVSTSGPAGPPADWACCRAGTWFSRTTGLQRARSTCRSSQGTGVCATNVQHAIWHTTYNMPIWHTPCNMRSMQARMRLCQTTLTVYGPAAVYRTALHPEITPVVLFHACSSLTPVERSIIDDAIEKARLGRRLRASTAIMV